MSITRVIGRMKITLYEEWSTVIHGIFNETDWWICFHMGCLYGEYSTEKQLFTIHVGLLGFCAFFEWMEGDKKSERFREWKECHDSM